MAGQLDSFWSGGLQTEGVRRLEHALARAPSEPTKSLRKALTAMSHRRFEAGDYPASRELSERALDIARTLGDDELIAASLSELALDLMLLGENAAARALFEESATVAEALGDIDSARIAHANLAWMAITHGDYDEARRLLEGLVQANREAGSTYHLAMNLCNLGWARHLLGDSSADQCFRESLGILRKVSTRDAAESITGLAGVAVRERREQDAARLLGLADAIMSEHEVQVEPFVRGLIAQSDAATRAALGDEEFQRLYAEGAAMDPEDAIDQLVAADR
jgi:tetratricopeptide (TPR) repeat protein